MHVFTHLLAGWAVAEHTVKTSRDRALVAWAGVVPDLDEADHPWACSHQGG